MKPVLRISGAHELTLRDRVALLQEKIHHCRSQFDSGRASQEETDRDISRLAREITSILLENNLVNVPQDD